MEAALEDGGGHGMSGHVTLLTLSNDLDTKNDGQTQVRVDVDAAVHRVVGRRIPQTRAPRCTPLWHQNSPLKGRPRCVSQDNEATAHTRHGQLGRRLGRHRRQ